MSFFKKKIKKPFPGTGAAGYLLLDMLHRFNRFQWSVEKLEQPKQLTKLTQRRQPKT